MKSSDLKGLKQISSNKKKRVLLINPKRKGISFTYPHNGLAILASIIEKRGHEVLVIDYAFMRENSKDVLSFIKEFNPDVIGLSVYTPNVNEGKRIISKIRSVYPNMPVMVGGPHATLYTDHLQKDPNIDYIVVGEGELVVLDIVEKAKRELAPKVIQSKEILDIRDLPYPNFLVFKDHENIRGYPIMTSRGCPFSCSFCASCGLSYRRWRARDPQDCINEIAYAKKTLNPNISIYVMDDHPTVDKKRFYRFLDLYSKNFNNYLHIINTRADAIDETLLKLMKRCGCKTLGIGVEHAHPEVFKLIDKKESLEQIEHACRLVKKYKMSLWVSFVLGVPGDSLERTKASIKFYKKVKADNGSINPIVPYRHTKAREWFEKNGATLYDEIGHDDYIKKDSFECEEPFVETKDFTKEERKKAYYMFLLETAHPGMPITQIYKIWKISKKYSLYSSFFYWLPRSFIQFIKVKLMLFKLALTIYQKEGFKQLIKRYRTRNK